MMTKVLQFPTNVTSRDKPTCREREAKQVFRQSITATGSTTLKNWCLHIKSLLFHIFSVELQT